MALPNTSSSGSGRSTWRDELPAGFIDREAFLYMGADPCWTPAREFKSVGGVDRAPGDCFLCGGVGSLVLNDDGSLSLHRDIPDGSRRVCARCMRYGRERLKVPELPDDPDVPVLAEPGYVSRDGITIPERYARLMKG